MACHVDGVPSPFWRVGLLGDNQGPRIYIYIQIYMYIRISLGDIHNLPTFWVLALFGTFYNFCFCVQTCRHLGGGYVYTF